ncbi:MAG: CPBP family intramembrane metalloprotease [Gammaproteobacteria bacterium]|nr:CPBP family intramembrane metalloprotease [Gammaproteobacteria bacterium]
MPGPPKLPDLWSGLTILALLFVVQLFIAATLYDMKGGFAPGDPYAVAIITLLANGLVIPLVVNYLGLGYRELFHAGSNSVMSMLVVLGPPILLVVLGANWWFNHLSATFIPPEVAREEAQMLQRLVGGGLVSVISVGLLAPIFEEIIFRGILLRGFLQHYGPRRGIILCALLFAGFHLTASQFPFAFVFGCFVGWLYWRTRSLWPCIVAHAGYNLIFFLVYYTAQRAPYDGITGSDIVSFAVSAIGFALLWQLLHGRRGG